MKLYNVPRHTRIRLLEDVDVPPGALPLKAGDVLRFKSVDGMYSYCTDQNGNVVHAPAWAEVEIVKTEDGE